MVNPTLSVITVVYNNARDIERTMLSVISQSYRHIEYIIIDGGSTDGTLDVIMRYKDQISFVLSEPDKGIYDAMNKGLARASGDYVLFMNSGDELYDRETVERVFSTAEDADIYYGETEMIDAGLNSLGLRRHRAPEQLTLTSFRFGMSVSHQAIYIRRSLCEPYDSRYELSADIEWILRALRKSKKVVNVGMVVARYLVGGMSKKRHLQSLKERYLIFNEFYGKVPNFLNHLVISFRLAFYFLMHRRTND